MFVLLQDILNFSIRAVGLVGGMKYLRTFAKRLNWERLLQVYGLPESLSRNGASICYPWLSWRGPTWNSLGKMSLYWQRNMVDTAQCLLQESLYKANRYYLFPEDLVGFVPNNKSYRYVYLSPFSPWLLGNSKLLSFDYRDGGGLLACRVTFWACLLSSLLNLPSTDF